MSSQKKVAVVTGAGSGVGKRSALALLQDGFSVVLAGRHAETLETTKTEAEKAGGRALVVPADVTDPESVKSLFSKTMEEFGRLDLLFNNAGIGAPPIPMEELTYEQWKAVVDVNLTGTFLCTQQAVKIMKNQKPMGGRIINNGSVSAHVPRFHSAPYTATKHAITGLTRSTSLDNRQFNILCSQIDIGNALTDRTARMAKGVLQADGSLRPEPTMDADNVARAIVFIANLPLDANVQFMTIMAPKMPYIGRG
ncbi:MAG: SDR family oxidoreductase [Spirochaetales bacterium]|nr:SDR family oxidoreductase [Spirochaetales bacterium]